MSEALGCSKNTADAIVVGGGAVGLHAANVLYDAMGNGARILSVTQESEWGGLAGRSLEQYRMFNDSYAMAEIVHRGVHLYNRLDEELREQKSTARASEQFPYIFTVGSKERPDYISELLPPSTPKRPDMAYYCKLKEDTERWGFDPRAEIMDAESLQKSFPLLDGDGIEGAMVVNNAGRLHFDVMRNWLMERTQADGDGHGVTYRTRTAAQQVLLGKQGEAIGVDFGGEKIYSDKIILALGAFVVNLPRLLPGDESMRLANNFTVTQRELFFSNMPGVQDDTNFFLISPDMAIARISTREGHASYGYAAEDDPAIACPVTDPKPNTDNKSLFVGRTYTMLGECSQRWDSDHTDPKKPNMAIAPFGYSAGSYTSYKDGLPVVGKIGDTNTVLVAGSHHSGIMGGPALAELAVDHVLGLHKLSRTTHEQTDIHRTPPMHTGLVL